jgi:iron complex transport system permease protein
MTITEGRAVSLSKSDRRDGRDIDSPSGPTAVPPSADPAPRRRAPGRLLIIGLSAALLVIFVAASAIGAYEIPVSQILGSVLHKLGIDIGPVPDDLGESVLWDVRFPRVVLAGLIGASLGCAGALMQGIFGNPLAEPGTIGVSAGAATGAAASIVAGISTFGTYTVTIAAFIGGLITTLLVYAVARSSGRTEVITLVLTGIAVNAFTGAAIGLLSFYSTDEQLRSITFWNLGSVASAAWPAVAAVAPCAVVGLLIAHRFARPLDLLALGEKPARHLGVNVERLRVSAILVVALLTAAAVAVAGAISFIGLVVPHLIRMIAGPGHRVLLPASALGGAVMVIGADLIARTAAAPAEIPLGSITALLGGPFFFWLILRTRKRQGGWA